MRGGWVEVQEGCEGWSGEGQVGGVERVWWVGVGERRGGAGEVRWVGRGGEGKGGRADHVGRT